MILFTKYIIAFLNYTCNNIKLWSSILWASGAGDRLCDYRPLFLMYVDCWSAIVSVECQIETRSSGEHPVQYTFRSNICSRTTTPHNLHLCTAYFSFCLQNIKCSAVIYCAEHWLLFPTQTLIGMHCFLRGMWRKHRLDTGFLYRRHRSK
jgi:hypothetical protein